MQVVPRILCEFLASALFSSPSKDQVESISPVNLCQKTKLLRRKIHRKLRRAIKGKKGHIHEPTNSCACNMENGQSAANAILPVLAVASCSDFPHSLDPYPLLSLPCVPRRNSVRGPVKRPEERVWVFMPTPLHFLNPHSSFNRHLLSCSHLPDTGIWQ